MEPPNWWGIVKEQQKIMQKTCSVLGLVYFVSLFIPKELEPDVEQCVFYFGCVVILIL